MLFQTLLTASLAATSVYACADHDYFSSGNQLERRADEPTTRDWNYDTSYNWGKIKPEYKLCQNGTQQTPLNLLPSQRTTTLHKPTFAGWPTTNVAGTFANWGFGPSFTLKHEPNVYTTLPFTRFDSETVYLIGWHTHAPSEHSIAGEKTHMEMHFVHVNAAGTPRAVLAFRIDPGSNAPNAFFSQLPSPPISYTETRTVDASINLRSALASVDNFGEYWTYEGSLTTPPCSEGLRWFVARTVLSTSDAQLQSLLGVSQYSSRVTQQNWRHRVNQ